MIISLCGFMGAGKSTVGKYLAQFLGYKFIDLDIYIEQKLGMSVSDFFSQNGEEAFRKEEFIALSEIVEEFYRTKSNLILALGGGTVTREACASIVREKTTGVYLYCHKDELVRRLRKRTANRPLLQGKSDDELRIYIQNLMDAREGFYKSCAKYTISTQSGQLSRVIDDILNEVEFEG